MKSLFGAKKTQLVGLDIGSRFVKAVLLAKQGDDYVLEGYACESVQGDAFSERNIKEFEPVASALRKVKHQLKLKNTPVAVAVSGSSVITKVVYMEPGQSDFELETQIEIEADSLIPYPLDEVYLDFEELGESKTHKGKVDVLLSAAHRDLVDSRITLLREQEFEPVIMDIEGYALGSAMVNFNPIGDGELQTCVNIGAGQLQISIIEEGEVIYSKEHPFGVDHLLQDLSVMYSLERADAAAQLLSGELPQNWKTDIYPQFVSNLQQQISRALQLFVTTTNKQRPQAIWLSGGGALIAGIAEDLQSELAMDVHLFDPRLYLEFGSKIDPELAAVHLPQLAVAFGLASRSFSAWHI